MDTYGASEVDDKQNELITILKARFKAVETNTYGLLIIFFNDEEREVESLVAIASHYSSLFDIDPHLPWYSFEENIINTKWRGDIALNITIDLQNYIESSLDRDRGHELLMLIKNNDQLKIESLLQAILMKPLADRNIIIETVSETITKESMNNVRIERNKLKTDKKSETSSIEPKIKSGNIINVELMLAPVSGIPIYELKKGDKIMVRIANTGVKEKYYIEQFGVKVDNNILPLPAEVVDITKNDKGEYVILVKLEKSVYGKAIETEQVKLKRYDTLVSSFEEDSELKIIESDGKTGKFPIFVMVIGGLMFAILLIFIIMWFYNII